MYLTTIEEVFGIKEQNNIIVLPEKNVTTVRPPIFSCEQDCGKKHLKYPKKGATNTICSRCLMRKPYT